jgi:hypothetical protein
MNFGRNHRKAVDIMIVAFFVTMRADNCSNLKPRRCIFLQNQSCISENDAAMRRLPVSDDALFFRKKILGVPWHQRRLPMLIPKNMA